MTDSNCFPSNFENMAGVYHTAACDRNEEE